MARTSKANDTTDAAGDTPSRSALRRQREREQRLQTILAVAERLFAREGYHKTGMERIADEAEVSVGTVYFYFKNKEDLLLQLLDQTGYELRDLLGDAFRNAGGTLEGIRRAGMVFFEAFCPRHPDKLAIVFRESAGQSELVEERRKRIFGKLIADVQEALQQVARTSGTGFRSAASAEVMATCILGMFERLSYHYLIWQQRPQDLQGVGQEAVEFIVGGVSNLMR
jgi:AcrR family transcriptional regulator